MVQIISIEKKLEEQAASRFENDFREWLSYIESFKCSSIFNPAKIPIGKFIAEKFPGSSDEDMHNWAVAKKGSLSHFIKLFKSDAKAIFLPEYINFEKTEFMKAHNNRFEIIKEKDELEKKVKNLTRLNENKNLIIEKLTMKVSIRGKSLSRNAKGRKKK